MDCKYLIWKLDEIPDERSICGYRKKLTTKEDFPLASFLLVFVSEAQEHYHEQTTEFYYILEGNGHLVLDGEIIAVGPQNLVMIKPGIRHRAMGDLKVLIIGIPPFDIEDQFLTDKKIDKSG